MLSSELGNRYAATRVHHAGRWQPCRVQRTRSSRRVAARSVCASGASAAQGQQPDPAFRQPEDRGSMKRILCSLLVVILPFGSVLADALKSKNAKVTLVYQHELPNVPGKSIKGVLV